MKKNTPNTQANSEKPADSVSQKLAKAIAKHTAEKPEAAPELLAQVQQQFRRNIIAIVSVLVSLIGLGYNTWRNEQTELNRSLRISAFEVLHTAHDLQQLVFFQRYDKDISDKGNPRSGWVQVLIINDLAQIMPTPLPKSAQELQNVWQNNWEKIVDNKISADAVLNKIDALREETLVLIKSLH